jgi:hydroxypyruvate isomerase
MQRRQFLEASLASASLAAAATASAGPSALGAPGAPGAAREASREGHQSSAQKPRNGRLRQAASRWCYGGIALDELCRAIAALGGQGVDLLDEDEWHVPAKFGLTCSMCNGPGGITKGWNRMEHHDELAKKAEPMLVKAAGLKLPNLIVFTGNRAGISDADGIKNCVTGLKRITPIAEKLGVTLHLEYLNSRHDHADYQLDRTEIGVAICKQEIGRAHV